uniref:Cyclin-like F-box n=1 Tax=Medicago truncatula TaxID=3880 RepID=Q2HSY9_MEDTR|nr:Cyclin-like F-box [Medicago truncatula]
MKRCTKLKSELPDSIISYIFSKLALKDLVKTSALSKRWVHEWGLRADLNFDLHTMFDYNTIQDLPNILPLFQIFHFQSEFTTRLDQFMLHYKVAMKRRKKLKSELPAMKRCTKLESELPDSVISYIFSKLALKDLVKTSALSKRWVHEWGLRTDLNFDLHTMFDSNTIQVPNTFPLYQRLHFQSEFATRLDQFMLHYKGAIIHSIRVKFPLVNPLHGDAISNAINRLISKGIAKGVKRIELLLSSYSVTSYILPLTLLSGNHSLTYLHLQDCLVAEPLDYCTGFNNLTTLVLDLISVTPKLVQSMCSIWTHLVDLTLDACRYPSDLIINHSTLLRLNIVNCKVYIRSCLTIIASNLSSFEYSCNDDYQVHPINIQAHMLSKFSFRGIEFFKPVGFSGLKNVTTIVLDGEIENLSMDILPYLFSECLQLEDVTFKNFRHMSSIEIITGPKLRHLKIIDCGWADYSPSEIAIDAFNLSSFEYSAHIPRIISITAPKLLKVFWNASPGRKTPHLLDPIARLSHIENLSMIILTSQIEELTKVLVRFQNLRQLELLIEGGYDPSRDYFWILDIAMASQHLQKLSLTVGIYYNLLKSV